MPSSRQCTPLRLPHNQTGLVGINRNSPCDGYFGCDEEPFETDKKALLSGKKDSNRNHLPWIRRKTPPVLSFFKRMASFRRQNSKPRRSRVNYYHTLPEPNTKSYYFGYKCFPFDSGISSMKRNYCCDGYFGCPPSNKV